MKENERKKAMKKYTINDFFAGEVDIRCKNDKQKMAVLNECEKRGVVWNDDKKAIPKCYIPECSVLEIDFYMNGKLTQSNGHSDRNVVDFDKINFQKYYRIVIDCDGDTTRAIMTVDGKEIKGAVARRNPEDKFNWRKGAELAFERLWNSPKKLGEKPEVREVKRFAKPGEYIKIVYVWDGYSNSYHKGDIFLVTRSYQGTLDGWVHVKGTNIAIYPKEYVVLEGYRP